MIVAVDWDGTVVVQDGRPYDDVTSPFVFQPGAKEGLAALKRAGHRLVLYSCRANRALREDPNLDPLVRAGVRRVNHAEWAAARPIHERRYRQMIEQVERDLPGLFDAIDDGQQGKPQAQLYIDNLALRFGSSLRGSSWAAIAAEYGAPGLRRR